MFGNRESIKEMLKSTPQMEFVPAIVELRCTEASRQEFFNPAMARTFIIEHAGLEIPLKTCGICRIRDKSTLREYGRLLFLSDKAMLDGGKLLILGGSIFSFKFEIAISGRVFLVGAACRFIGDNGDAQ